MARCDKHYNGKRESMIPLIKYVTKERLDQLSETGKHQGVIAQAAAYEYAEVEDILENAREKGEDAVYFPSWIILRILITWEQSSVRPIWPGLTESSFPKRRAVGLTAAVAKTSAGALNYTPVAKVTNLAATIEELKKEGLWFVCADMGGELHVPSESEGSHWSGDRKRRRGCQPSGKREVRLTLLPFP